MGLALILEERRGKDDTTVQEWRRLEGGRFMLAAYNDGRFKLDQHQGLHMFHTGQRLSLRLDLRLGRLHTLHERREEVLGTPRATLRLDQ